MFSYNAEVIKKLKRIISLINNLISLICFMLFLSINMDYKSTVDQKVKVKGEKGKKWSLPLKTTLIYLYLSLRLFCH